MAPSPSSFVSAAPNLRSFNPHLPCLARKVSGKVRSGGGAGGSAGVVSGGAPG